MHNTFVMPIELELIDLASYHIHICVYGLHVYFLSLSKHLATKHGLWIVAGFICGTRGGKRACNG